MHICFDCGDNKKKKNRYFDFFFYFLFLQTSMQFESIVSFFLLKKKKLFFFFKLFVYIARKLHHCAPAAFLRSGSRFSGSLSGIEPYIEQKNFFSMDYIFKHFFFQYLKEKKMFQKHLVSELLIIIISKKEKIIILAADKWFFLKKKFFKKNLYFKKIFYYKTIIPAFCFYCTKKKGTFYFRIQIEN